MEGSQLFLQIPPPYLHCMCISSAVFFSPFFFFYLIPVTFLLRSLDNGIQQKLQEEIFLQQNDQCSDIQPPSWSHCTLSVSTSQSWGCGRVSVGECVCVCVPGSLEGSSGVPCPCRRLQSERSWSPAGCAAGASTFSGNCWCGVMDYVINGYE